MKIISWDDSLSVGVEEIDQDHRRLVELFNLLSEAVENRESAEYIDALLVELISCTEWHFRHEERLMIRHGYDGMEDHKDEHIDLVDNVRDLQRRFYEAHQTLTTENISYLADWLTGHIVGVDMRMGYFLAQKM
jgi:hemerythrin